MSFSGNFSSKKLNRVPGWFAVLEINLTMKIVSFRVDLSSEFFIENAGFFYKGWLSYWILKQAVSLFFNPVMYLVFIAF